ncbi:hypothetical protein SBOR_3788 [Sclerotinia borealis F-4128]|uniref:Uncharacterized protein n=1 Tax=Sclerotinia borealis (strain F-4128) TaxID=1432307 RepID=W9CJ32_SCLBF|nr:hypothetical protein SBOR_3788 [Sclerotinia borealis F-4128]
MALPLQPAPTTCEPSQFLQLPAELRIKIYMYLIPDSNLHHQLGESPWRQDGGSCSPAILRLNRKIHYEIYGLWYGVATFSFRLDSKSIFLNGGYFMRDGCCELPAALKSVKSLAVITLPVRLPSAHTASNKKWDSESPKFIVHLANFLADGSCLERLLIHLDMRTRVWASLTQTLEDVHMSLEKTLSPFRVIRGLTEFTTTFPMDAADQEWIPTPPERRATIERWTRSYLDKFEANMLHN